MVQMDFTLADLYCFNSSVVNHTAYDTVPGNKLIKKERRRERERDRQSSFSLSPLPYLGFSLKYNINMEGLYALEHALG